MQCGHKSHLLSTRNESTYASQTCRSCLQTGRRSINAAKVKQETYVCLQRRPSSLKKDSAFKTKSLVSITDPVSNYATPGIEATESCFSPHIVLLNKHVDIRPSEHQKFAEDVSNTLDQAIQSCESLIENNEGQLSEELFDKCIIDDEKPKHKSIAEEKMKDKKFADDLLLDKERLNRMAMQQFYKTTTQELYEGVNWKNIMRNPTPLKLPFQHDTRELDKQKQRFNTEITFSQKIDPACWDRAQTRNGFFVRRPVAFTSVSKQVNHIPNYSGSIGGVGEKDVEHEPFTSFTLQRTTQPKYQQVSRKPFIPGYTGHTHYLKTSDVFSGDKMPRLESTARAHSRFHTYPQNISTVSRQGHISNSVSLIHPYNPYNQVSYPTNRTSSSIRIS